MTYPDPRFTAALPLTAQLPAPFTPKILDPGRMRREREDALDRDSAEIDRDEANISFGVPAGGVDSASQVDPVATLVESDARANIMRRREQNAEHRTNLEKAHATHAARVVSSPTFMLRVPTPLDRDQLQVRLIENGAEAIGQEQLRATMIEALFRYDWSEGEPGWDVTRNEQQATEHADFLDGLWMVEEAHNKALREWQEQEVERILDQWNGAPDRAPDAKPPRLISVRDNARQILLVDKLMQTPMMRRISMRQMDYERRHRMILVRLNLIGVTGIPGYTQPALVQQGMWDIAEVEGLRQAMDDAYGADLASPAWDELVERISRAYTLDGFEEKNSDSPPGNTIDQNSSVEPSGASASSDGTSTASPISPTPSGASEPITETSSDYGSGFETQTARPNDGQTDAGSSISQSS